jgi:flagellar protein FliO/FliZ
MMSPFAPACLPVTLPSRQDAVPVQGNTARGAKTLLALALLMPLAACAAQPATPASAAAAQQQATAEATPRQEAPALRQDGTAPAPRAQDDSATAAPAPQAAAPAGTTSVPAAKNTDTATQSRPAQAPLRLGASSTGTPAGIPVAERATTVGEVPTTPGTVNPAPDAASMPGAPAAIPGTPANPAPIQVGQAAAAPSAGTLVQTILALMLVLGLLAALAWAMKRYGPRVAGNSANLRMVGALNIGGRERIMVVEVGDQWIVVGASPGRVNALATMPKGEGTAATATLAGHAPPAATFSDWLKQTIDKRNAK